MKYLFLIVVLLFSPAALASAPKQKGDLAKQGAAKVAEKAEEKAKPVVISHPSTGVRHKLTVDKQPRIYHLALPKHESNKPRPLLIVMHGGGGTGRAIAEKTGFTALGEREDILVAYPEGMGRLQSWNAGKCCGYASRTKVDDVAFIRQMVMDIRRKHAIDKDRIYAVGFSNGGMMSYRLACEMGDVFAALGVVSGAMNTEQCTPTGRPSIVIFHARNDQQVPYNGGAATGGLRAALAGKPAQDRSVKDAMDFWIKANLCRAYPSEDSQSDMTVVNYFCAQKRDLRLYTLNGGGHSWPGGIELASDEKPSEDILPEDLPSTVPATELIWEFFKNHPPRELF